MSTVTNLPEVPAQVLRSADLAQAVKVLRSRRAQKLDVVVPTNQLSLQSGNLLVQGLDSVQVPEHTVLREDGVETIPGFTYNPSGLYRPTSIVDQHIASLFEIPVRYIRKLRDQDVELLDINVNRHAERATGSNLVRLIWGQTPGDEVTTGIVRAVLSDRYAIIDHLDTVMSILAGLDELGISGDSLIRLDLSERKLYMEIDAPQIAVHGRELVQNYRSPFTGQTGAELPLINAGIKITNSEIGHGAFEVKPFARFQVCMNGATIDAIGQDKVGLRKVHVGKQLDSGVINWSQDTMRAANELVRSQVKDAVGQYLSVDFLQAAVDEWRALAGVEVKRPADTIKVVADELSWTEAEMDNILNKFTTGGQTHAFGVGQAVTAAVQDITDPDRAHELGEQHLKAATIAAREASKA
ncbi:hypothetical protein ALICE_63 [Mycobacterium phage Alice]|uniref:Uncharacterized protein n=4 Tax=Bixzunavirus TaxID=680114 RepID=R4TCQ9_9CAUD|nr:hypothetical protein M182_gp071 [Mycobacterium phage Astraea]YP_009216328.1 hypothetical protein ALICE_63 [Mycobacterium phage Alice]YP_009597664.1 hypothetical protein FDH18_gp061 [Mycobacterium phage Lukilu]ACU41593.1 hypothetical protein LRRHOOD_65 [Mycobacterium phage LRRHood]ATN90030.1 hypothetical protein SEA_KOGUMA_66 [Mycobacterium phage Koguma]ATN91349.1 hypothetical protein SEA_PHOX_67 [Mycobacterium phage Phox]QAY05027.1 hypothetical protein SEA_SHAQNATO_63 [Mycobacterium phage 